MDAVSGNKALKEIEKILGKARVMLADVDREFGHSRESLAELRQREVGIYAKLARLRLLAIEQGDLPSALDEADSKAADVLEERKDAAGKLDRRIESAEDALAAEERRRAEQHTAVEVASEALDAAEAAAQEKLAADAAWQAQIRRTEHTNFVADQAEEKADAAGKNRAVKGKPYENDPLFAYLWARGYGTSSYRAWPLTRFLDGKVAKLCKFEPARRNYALLTEIPVRLAEHAQAMRAAFDHETETLAALEDAAAGTAGVPRLAAALEAAEKKLDEIDAAIAERENAIRTLVEERKTFVTGNDSHYQRCLKILSDAMRRKGVRLLEENAARTPGREDDDLVRQLVRIQREAENAEQSLTEFGRLHDRENERVGVLEDVRRRFKAERFDDSLSEFKNWALVALILNQFLSGAARSGDIWKTIQRQQRRKAMQATPDFGSLRFPKAPKHGPWRLPKGGFGGGGRGGGFGGGGFRTGGGFKGGGFKTGGGF
ncbi:MAG TPA: hypothetical protein VMR74_06730 [Gammaproteobacteria bacterium]|nr:hypothetical protein [Gammaproteobacteria bacterium]